MSLWIKICANTSLADAQLAADAGADAVGLVFAPSPRRVTITQAAAIVPHLSAALEKIGVFVDAHFAEIASTVEACSLTGVQLHFDAPPKLPAQLRQRFGPSLRIISVVHFNATSLEQFADVAADPNIDATLVDSRTATAPGGTGVAYDWIAASKTLFRESEVHKRHLVVAGGLTPANVAEAIATLHPWGVDVVSGVESAPGKKDPERVKAFIANARAADIER
jgi:phosphoribosylanthranilate isomerase